LRLTVMPRCWYGGAGRSGDENRVDHMWGGPLYGRCGPVLLNARIRIRASLNRSRAATCRDFACKIREIGWLFCAVPENRFNWLKHSQSSLIAMMMQRAY
jgi:hypothetical protein